jgi:hypothetical protein
MGAAGDAERWRAEAAGLDVAHAAALRDKAAAERELRVRMPPGGAHR